MFKGTYGETWQGQRDAIRRKGTACRWPWKASHVLFIRYLAYVSWLWNSTSLKFCEFWTTLESSILKGWGSRKAVPCCKPLQLKCVAHALQPHQSLRFSHKRGAVWADRFLGQKRSRLVFFYGYGCCLVLVGGVGVKGKGKGGGAPPESWDHDYWNNKKHHFFHTRQNPSPSL